MLVCCTNYREEAKNRANPSSSRYTYLAPSSSPLRHLLVALATFSLHPSSVLLSAEPPSAPQLRIEAGMHTATIRRIAVASIASGTRVLTCSDDKTARLWLLQPGSTSASASASALSSMQPQRILRLPIGPGDEGKVYACALSPDGRIAALGGWTSNDSGNSESICLFDADSGQMLRRLPGLPNTINDLAFSASGQFLAAGPGGKNGIRIWQVASGQLLASDSDYGDSCYGLDWQGDDHLATTC